MKPVVSVSKTSNSAKFQSNLKKVGKRAVYVGIPATTAEDRNNQILNMISKKTSKKALKLLASASGDMNNAELLYIFSKGSPVRGQPARPVLEPAIAATGNKEAIAYELAQASKATLAGNTAEATRRIRKAGIAGENAAKAWFTDGRNGWAPNTQSTIDKKGSDKPGINIGAMRNAITSVTKEDTDE